MQETKIMGEEVMGRADVSSNRNFFRETSTLIQGIGVRVFTSIDHQSIYYN